jgi:hypothetical protein
VAVLSSRNVSSAAVAASASAIVLQPILRIACERRERDSERAQLERRTRGSRGDRAAAVEQYRDHGDCNRVSHASRPSEPIGGGAEPQHALRVTTLRYGEWAPPMK